MESINVFYESMKDFFETKGWRWTPPRRQGEKWIQEDYSVEIRGKYSDGAYRDVLFTMRRTPGLIGQSRNKEHLSLGYQHKFMIYLPREYPANLSHIKMRAVTKLWHPRISTGRSGEACITVNGELDRILIDLIYHVLMDPKRIRPPKIYPKEDFGMNGVAMRWYEKDAEDIYQTMFAKWAQRHEKAELKETGGIRIIGDDSSSRTSPKKKSSTIQIMGEHEEEKDDEGSDAVRIL
ncbi:MAG: hypothetical protein GF308_04550 [Candidatus Heimdallarchaeota archaeon]|nr:hypothetical protein [Candidatus Heimdallarchaeota archaeon]